MTSRSGKQTPLLDRSEESALVRLDAPKPVVVHLHAGDAPPGGQHPGLGPDLLGHEYAPDRAQARVAIEALLAETTREELEPLAADLEADRTAVAEAANAALAGDPPEALSLATAEAVARIEAALRRRRLRSR